MGLGLPVAHQLAVALGGSLSLTREASPPLPTSASSGSAGTMTAHGSGFGGVTRFALRVPVAPADVEQRVREELSGAGAGAVATAADSPVASGPPTTAIALGSLSVQVAVRTPHATRGSFGGFGALDAYVRERVPPIDVSSLGGATLTPEMLWDGSGGGVAGAVEGIVSPMDTPTSKASVEPPRSATAAGASGTPSRSVRGRRAGSAATLSPRFGSSTRLCEEGDDGDDGAGCGGGGLAALESSGGGAASLASFVGPVPRTGGDGSRGSTRTVTSAAQRTPPADVQAVDAPVRLIAAASVPLAAGTAAAVQAARAVHVGRVAARRDSAVAGLHVLYADDERLNCAVMSRLLSRLGIPGDRVTVVEDGADVYAPLAATGQMSGGGVSSDSAGGVGGGRPRAWYDVVILDIVMRRECGDTTCRNLRRGGVTVPIIAATGNAHDREALLADGFNEVLEKPFTLAQLRVALEAVAGGRYASAPSAVGGTATGDRAAAGQLGAVTHGGGHDCGETGGGVDA
jgi:CheY-like chemotaxis protein